MKGHIAGGARGDGARGEHVRWGAQLRAQVVRCQDSLRWPPRLSHGQRSSLLWGLWIMQMGAGTAWGIV